LARKRGMARAARAMLMATKRVMARKTMMESYNDNHNDEDNSNNDNDHDNSSIKGNKSKMTTTMTLLLMTTEQ
jgi:hypothetical protein